MGVKSRGRAVTCASVPLVDVLNGAVQSEENSPRRSHRLASLADEVFSFVLCFLLMLLVRENFGLGNKSLKSVRVPACWLDTSLLFIG